MNYLKRLLGLPREFTKDEMEELRGLLKLVNGEKYKLAVFKNNTAVIPRGKMIAYEQENIVKLLERAQSEYTSTMLGRLGYPPGTILKVDFKTGKTSKVEPSAKQLVNEPGVTK